MNYFPHLIALIIGCIILWIIKRKYKKIRNRELIIIFILYVLLIGLFTDRGIDLARQFINYIQLD